MTTPKEKKIITKPTKIFLISSTTSIQLFEIAR